MNYRQHYSEEKALREEQKHAAGLLSERFPQVLAIVIDMTFNRKALNPANMKRTMYFYPDTYAYFHLGCMTRSCEDGGFDLSHVITTMVRDHAETRTGEMECSNADRNHASILYEIKVKYALDH